MPSERLIRRGERIVRTVASRLPPPRDDAFVTAAEAGFALLTGRRARGGLSTYKEPRINPVAFRQALSAYYDGDQHKAGERIEALVAAHPDSIRVQRLRRDIMARRGDLTGQARALHAIHQLDDTDERQDAERLLLGRLVETSPGWLPRIPGRPRPVVPADESVVLHLLKESVPYLTNGFTMRSRYNLLAARAAGARPVVVTSLGFPRLLGTTEFPALEDVDGIPHHRLDLGAFYPLEQPFDRLLEHQAWLTAAIARRVRPAVIHVSSGHRGYETALVGLALREHIRRPVVYEVRSFFESTWTADPEWSDRGEQYLRRHDAETRAMRAADRVITIAETMRDDIVARGVDPARVTVVANGVDPDAFTPEPPDPALLRRYRIDGRFVFGYVSNIDHPRENQELLVEATARLLHRGREVACLIVGDGKRREEVERLAAKAGVKRWVVFTGRVPHREVNSHYAILDAFVVPRRDERSARTVTPLKPYEALAMARPLVVADLPALVEIAAPDERGLAFRAEDPDALADAIERLMDDRELGRRLGLAGRAWVERERPWSANGPRFQEVYRDVLEEWNGRSGGGAG
jgi:glycosyltransferase involved in cell wall biosynthesis